MYQSLGVGLGVLTVDQHEIQAVDGQNLAVGGRAGSHEGAQGIAVGGDLFLD